MPRAHLFLLQRCAAVQPRADLYDLLSQQVKNSLKQAQAVLRRPCPCPPEIQIPGEMVGNLPSPNAQHDCDGWLILPVIPLVIIHVTFPQPGTCARR